MQQSAIMQQSATGNLASAAVRVLEVVKNLTRESAAEHLHGVTNP
jgi:hypothetical protein